ncbi:MAG: DUF58 domain-containing protein [Verrucomicrobiales bacterium]
MAPSKRLLYLALLWLASGLFASLWPDFMLAWIGIGGLIAVGGVADAILLFYLARPTAERVVPGRFALGVEGEVAVTLHNPGKYPMFIDLFDGIPDACETEGLPWTGKLPARGYTRVTYPAKMTSRGMMRFTPAHIRVPSPFGLWLRRFRCGEMSFVRAYPNYEPVIRFALLAMDHREEQMGILQRQRAGVSREFHQLRDYQEGDSIAQVDWKATSRHRSLISREYREQRNQSVVALVDCGRRMRAMDGDLAQFDHCLNALLLLSYIALRQGDHVGVMSFGGPQRWLPPVKGQHSMTTLLNHLYDYQTTNEPSDFSEAAQNLMVRQKRRALVLVMTNLRSEDASDLLPSLRLISRRHVVVLASLRERSLDQVARTPIGSLDDALACAGAHLYFEERRAVLEQIRASGALTIDAPAQSFPIELANRYLEIKRAGRL